MRNEAELIEGIKAALEHSGMEMSLLDVLEGIVKGSHKVLEVGTGFIVVCVDEYPQHKELKLCIAYGYLDETLPDIMAFLEKLARDLSCKKLKIEGRRGWARKLEKFGYHEQYVIVTKEVSL